MRPSRHGLLAKAIALAALDALATPAGSVWAQDVNQDNPAPLPPPAHLDAPVRTPRPRLTAAIGMGVSYEPSGFDPARTEIVPAFFATGGVGADWRVGVELAAFASSSAGRFAAQDAPVDRLALALMGVARPAAWWVAEGDARYLQRVARASGLEVGFGLERVGTTMRAGSRYGVHLGARVELPLVPFGGSSELRLRLAARHMVGLYTPTVGTVEVGDGSELYGALVTVF